jgi:hypothetical protein
VKVLGNSSHVLSMGDALLGLAIDLGSRLLPAFDTATGIPYGEALAAFHGFVLVLLLACSCVCAMCAGP